MEEFHHAMEKILAELRDLNPSALSNDEYARRIDALRMEYFRRYGKFESLCAGSRNAAAPVGGSDCGNSTQRYPSQWGIISGIIAAALIVSLTLLFIFG